MDVDTSAAVGRKSPGTVEAASSVGALSALQEVAASLASVKSAIKTGAADRNQVIDMLTNLLRETLQVSSCFAHPNSFHCLVSLQRCRLLLAGPALCRCAGRMRLRQAFSHGILDCRRGSKCLGCAGDHHCWFP